MTFLCKIRHSGKKTVAHTSLSSFDNANGRLFQERLLRSRKRASMVTECLALELQRTITSNNNNNNKSESQDLIAFT